MNMRHLHLDLFDIPEDAENTTSDLPDPAGVRTQKLINDNLVEQLN